MAPPHPPSPRGTWPRGRPAGSSPVPIGAGRLVVASPARARPSAVRRRRLPTGHPPGPTPPPSRAGEPVHRPSCARAVPPAPNRHRPPPRASAARTWTAPTPPSTGPPRAKPGPPGMRRRSLRAGSPDPPRLGRRTIGPIGAPRPIGSGPAPIDAGVPRRGWLGPRFGLQMLASKPGPPPPTPRPSLPAIPFESDPLRASTQTGTPPTRGSGLRCRTAVGSTPSPKSAPSASAP